MKTFFATLLLAITTQASCGALPSYLQTIPRTPDQTRLVIESIQKDLGDGFSVEQVDPCFFLASNASPETTRRSRETLSNVTRLLYERFFDRVPEKPIRVYLFRDKGTYDAYCRASYSSPPSTPYGFYMTHERKIVLNIATGHGTLAHELVHPLLADNFPDVPTWFNEGFASLYEQSETRGGKIVGLVNWRLPGLQQALKSDRGIPFRELFAVSAQQFYGSDRGSRYATARYLCYWLQENGLLEEFYRTFRGSGSTDPTGAAALERVTQASVDELESRWQKWVLTLKYDG